MSDLAIVAIAISAPVIFIVVFIAVIIIVRTVCKYKTEQVRHTNETEKEIAEILAGSNKNSIIETDHLSAKDEDKGKKFPIVTRKMKKITSFIMWLLT